MDYPAILDKLLADLKDIDAKDVREAIQVSCDRATGGIGAPPVPLADAIRDALLAGRDAQPELAAWLNARALGRAASPH